MLKGLLVYLYTQCGLDEVKLLRIIMEGRTVVGIFYVDKIYSKTRTRSGFNLLTQSPGTGSDIS
jgi:hypothetical protein